MMRNHCPVLAFKVAQARLKLQVHGDMLYQHVAVLFKANVQYKALRSAAINDLASIKYCCLLLEAAQPQASTQISATVLVRSS